MPFLAYLLARLAEPSSYAGLGAVLALLGLHLSDTILGQLAQALAAGCGLAALLLRERGLIRVLAPVAVIAGATLLAACSPAQQIATVADAQTALDQTASAVAAIGSGATPLLTKVQDAACAGQAVVNTVTDMLDATGHPAAAATSAKISGQLGLGCVWPPAARS